MTTNNSLLNNNAEEASPTQSFPINKHDSESEYNIFNKLNFEFESSLSDFQKVNNFSLQESHAPFSKLRRDHNEILGKIAQLRKRVRNLKLLKNEIEQQTSDSYVNFITLNQQNQMNIFNKLSLDLDQERYESSIIFDRDDRPIKRNSIIHQKPNRHLDRDQYIAHESSPSESLSSSPSNLKSDLDNKTEDQDSIVEDDEESIQNDLEFQDSHNESFPIVATKINQDEDLEDEDRSRILDNNNTSTRAEWNKLLAMERKIQLVSKWYQKRIEEISTLHMEESQKGSHLRVKYQSTLRSMEDDRQTSLKNISFYKKEIYRLGTIIEPALRNECDALKKNIQSEIDKGNMLLQEQALNLLK